MTVPTSANTRFRAGAAMLDVVYVSLRGPTSAMERLPASLALTVALCAGAWSARAQPLSFAEVKATGAQPLTIGEVKALVTGTRTELVLADGSQRAWTNAPDGSVVVGGDSADAKRRSGHGTWWVNDAGGYCIGVDWGAGETERWCRQLYKVEDRYYAFGRRARDDSTSGRYRFVADASSATATASASGAAGAPPSAPVAAPALAAPAPAPAARTNPHDGNWNVTAIRAEKPGYSATLVVEGDAGSWKMLRRNKDDPCIGRSSPIEVLKATANELHFRIKTSEALQGCRDNTVRLRRSEDGTLTGSRGSEQLTATRP